MKFLKRLFRKHPKYHKLDFIVMGSRKPAPYLDKFNYTSRYATDKKSNYHYSIIDRSLIKRPRPHGQLIVKGKLNKIFFNRQILDIMARI
jgi:hypothetical protein